MTDIQEQMRFENDMVQRTIDRFQHIQDRYIDRGHAIKTSAGSRLLKVYVSQVSKAISDYTGSKKGNGRTRYVQLIASVDPDKLALITLSNVIRSAFREEYLGRTAQEVGLLVENECRCSEFERANPVYFRAMMKQIKERKSMSLKYLRANISDTMEQKRIPWIAWDMKCVHHVGSLLLSVAISATDLVYREVKVYRGKTRGYIRGTAEFEDWVIRHNEAAAFIYPEKMPCLIQPADWTTRRDGGYYSPRLNSRTPLLKIHHTSRDKENTELVDAARMPAVFTAVNALQHTAWRVNRKVLGVVQEVWDKDLGIGLPKIKPLDIPVSPLPPGLDTKQLTEEQADAFREWKVIVREVWNMEVKRKGSLLGSACSMRMAQMMSDKEKFHYVYQTDFRGRIYPVGHGMTPQGSDMSRGCLEFAQAIPGGKEGLYWLAVHGANKYGKNKIPYDSRVSWINENADKWEAVSEDPIGRRDLWKNADKPFQFLAFCLEYSRARKEDGFASRIPVSLDGTCNGLQHFCAMLRDEEIGPKVNLTGSDCPRDIYQEIADMCSVELDRISNRGGPDAIYATNWKEHLRRAGYASIPRTITKQPVMTFVYNSTLQSSYTSIHERCNAYGILPFPGREDMKHCVFLAGLIRRIVADVLIRPAKGMEWIKTVAGMTAEAGRPLIYHSPLGFPVYQVSYKVRKSFIKCTSGAGICINLQTPTDIIDKRKMVNSAPANMIHHADACHLMMCLNEGVKAGIGNFSTVHDDFAVHAAHVPAWNSIVREQFYKMHTEHDILGDIWKAALESSGSDIPPPPVKGTLDLRKVKNSRYFFG